MDCTRVQNAVVEIVFESRQIKLKVLFDAGISDDVTGYEIQHRLGVIERREFDCPLRTSSGR